MGKRKRGGLPVGTVARLIKTNEFVRIVSRCVMYQDPNDLGFLHYMMEIEGRVGQYAGYDEDLEVEVLPLGNNKQG